MLKKAISFSVEYVLYYILHEHHQQQRISLDKNKQNDSERKSIKMCACMCLVGTFFGDEKKNRFENPFFSLFFPMDRRTISPPPTSKIFPTIFFIVRSFVCCVFTQLFFPCSHNKSRLWRCFWFFLLFRFH